MFWVIFEIPLLLLNQKQKVCVNIQCTHIISVANNNLLLHLITKIDCIHCR